MRFDDVGMFWQDFKAEGSRNRYERPLAPIPDTGWATPVDFPDLSAAKAIAVDCETLDPRLPTHGPGWARGEGHIVGVSICTDDLEFKAYYPVRHSVEPEWNLNPDHVLHWLRNELSRTRQPKVGANLFYDVGWLHSEGVEVKGTLYDVLYAETLLREQGLISLDEVAKTYLQEQKTSELLYQWCSDSYGGPIDGKQRKNIHRAPPRLVGPYAESDVDLPMRIIGTQYSRLEKEGLTRVYDLECRLIPLLVRMYEQGVHVDLDRAEDLRSWFEQELIEEQDRLNHLVGFELNIDSGAQLKKAFDQLGLKYPITARGNPSFAKAVLANIDHPITNSITEIRKYRGLIGTFIDSYILGSHKEGIVHCQFHPLKPRSGRFSSSNPNLQNIPIRDKTGRLIRSIFIPEKGKKWFRYDYNQIEYRFLVHYARGPHGDEIRQYFRDHPNTDYHNKALELVAPYSKWDISTEEKYKAMRRPIKDINFGFVYGMGKGKLARSLKLSTTRAQELFNAYHTALPFVRETMDYCSKVAAETGEITTILGRKSRFDLWEPIDYDGPALTRDKALRLYGTYIRRASLHKALNRRLQGSAADLMKVAMVRCYEDGVFDTTGIPLLTVHDELDFQSEEDRREAYREMQRIMETALELSIPITADGEVGENWGSLRPL